MLQGNKGGVGIRFRIYDSYMVFVNSHLASGTKEVERRNLDFREISQKLLFPNSAGTLDDPNKVPTIYDSEYEHAGVNGPGVGPGAGSQTRQGEVRQNADPVRCMGVAPSLAT